MNIRSDPFDIRTSAPPGRDLRPWFFDSALPDALEGSIDGFLKPGARIDPLGLATVLCLGYAVGGRTVLASVRTNEIDPRTLAADRAPDDAQISELTVHAVGRHIGDERPIALLSGGRDSRLILMAMHRLGVAPRAVLTLDQAGRQSDAAVAGRVAASIGLRVSRVQPLAFDGERERDRHLRQSFQSLEHSWFMSVSERVRGLDGPVTDGIGAGVLSTGSLLAPEAVGMWKSRAIDALAEWTADHGGCASPAFFAAARAEGLPIATRDEVLHEVVRVLRSLDGTPNPLGLYSLLHWTRRGIGGSAYGLLPWSRVRTPLYDTELCRALAAMPMERAMATDWRETALRSLDKSGAAFATAEGGLLPRPLRNPVRTLRSRLGWNAFVRSLPPALRRLSVLAGETKGMRRSFDRSALGLLASLDRSTGFASGRPADG